MAAFIQSPATLAFTPVVEQVSISIRRSLVVVVRHVKAHRLYCCGASRVVFVDVRFVSVSLSTALVGATTKLSIHKLGIIQLKRLRPRSAPVEFSANFVLAKVEWSNRVLPTHEFRGVQNCLVKSDLYGC